MYRNIYFVFVLVVFTVGSDTSLKSFFPRTCYDSSGSYMEETADIHGLHIWDHKTKIFPNQKEIRKNGTVESSPQSFG